MRTSRLAARIIDRIENTTALDALGEKLNGALGALLPSGPVEDTLSGTPIGHPLHPAVVALPIGAWTSALAMDVAGEDDAARRLVGLGVLTAIPATASGGSDWLTTDGAERRVGLVHALANYAAITSFGLSWVARGRGNRRLGVGLSAFGAVLVSGAGWLGGHLTYAQGVGVDATVFESLPDDWTDAGAVDDLPAEGGLARRDVGGVPILVSHVDGRVRAMSDRCTHRGAPLDEGEIADGCVVCPWHASAFDLDDGSVRSGPATRPQPTLETRVREGRLELRRSTERTIGGRSVGP